MRWGRVEATGGFFLMLAWLNYLDRQWVVPLALAACTLHELGHYWAIRVLGGDIKLIRLTAVGAEMVVARPLDYWREGLAALAGPAVNAALALLCTALDWGAGFAGVNLALALFNLAPVGRLDGGRLLNCSLALLAGPEAAGCAGAWVDLLCGAALLAGGLFLAGAGGNVTLLLAALWVLAMLARQYGRPFWKK